MLTCLPYCLARIRGATTAASIVEAVIGQSWKDARPKIPFAHLRVVHDALSASLASDATAPPSTTFVSSTALHPLHSPSYEGNSLTLIEHDVYDAIKFMKDAHKGTSTAGVDEHSCEDLDSTSSDSATDPPSPASPQLVDFPISFSPEYHEFGEPTSTLAPFLSHTPASARRDSYDKEAQDALLCSDVPPPHSTLFFKLNIPNKDESLASILFPPPLEDDLVDVPPEQHVAFSQFLTSTSPVVKEPQLYDTGDCLSPLPTSEDLWQYEEGVQGSSRPIMSSPAPPRSEIILPFGSSSLDVKDKDIIGDLLHDGFPIFHLTLPAQEDYTDDEVSASMDSWSPPRLSSFPFLSLDEDEDEDEDIVDGLLYDGFPAFHFMHPPDSSAEESETRLNEKKAEHSSDFHHPRPVMQANILSWLLTFNVYVSES